MSFSVRPGVAVPPSLKNIYKELHNNAGFAIPTHGCLLAWARQGVVLLNTVLTVREGQPGSHRGKGWEAFTDKVIALLSRREAPLVFMLWGSHAQAKRQWIGPGGRHLILEAPHLSPSGESGYIGQGSQYREYG